MPTFTAPYDTPSSWTTSGTSVTISSNLANFDCDPNSSTDTSYAEVATGSTFAESWTLNITFNMLTNPNGGEPNPPWGGEGMWAMVSDTSGNPSSGSGSRIAFGIYGNKAVIWWSNNSTAMSVSTDKIDISPATTYNAVLSRVDETTVTLTIGEDSITQTIPDLPDMDKFIHAVRTGNSSGQTYTGYFSSVSTGTPATTTARLPPPPLVVHF